MSMKVTFLVLGLAIMGACSDGGSEANRRGVGAECAKSADCTEQGQTCLTAFKGGYCGVSPCAHDVDCPNGSACVTEDSGINYCFLVCADKAQCNDHRSVDNEANCVSSLPFIDAAMGRKVCRPPMGG